MKITVVMDNNVPTMAQAPFVAEHGLSFLIEEGGKTILFDTGQTGGVITNLDLIGVHPSALDMIVLSHGHYDHTGGLAKVLQLARKDVEVVAHACAFDAHGSASAGKRRYVGVPFAREHLQGLGGVWDLREGPRRLTEKLYFSGSVPRVTDYEVGDPRLVKANVEDQVPDNIDDDISLFYSGERGLVVIGGCAHSGLVNTVKHGFAVTGLDKLQGWIGGTHLGPAPADQQDRTIAQLQAWQPELVAANHCTGFAMLSRLQQIFGERFKPAFVGETITV